MSGNGATIPMNSSEKPFAWSRRLATVCPKQPAIWGAMRRGWVAGHVRLKRNNARRFQGTGGCRSTRRNDPGDATHISDFAWNAPC